MTSIVAKTPDNSRNLAGVMPELLASLGVAAATGSTGGKGTVAPLPSARSAIVILVDGLGAGNLREHAAFARFLTATKTPAISSVFPSTTAAALTSLTTGVLPGEHGLTGYLTFDAAGDRLVNQLTGWDRVVDPATWQRVPTGFETAVAGGIAAYSVGPGRYRSSGFTNASLRGAEYVSAETIAERLDLALALAARGPSLTYVYVPELDQIGHRLGVASPEWSQKLEELDGALRRFVAALPAKVGAVLTADHGMIDVPEHGQILFDQIPGLVDGIRHVGGEPRLRQLYFEPDASEQQRAATVAAWRAAEGHRARILTRDEAIADSLFGLVAPEVRSRIGDLLIAATKRTAYYDSRPADQGSRGMVGQHGAFSEDETRVPWYTWGAFAR